MTRARGLLAGAAGVISVLAVAVPALAYWTATAAGDSRASVGSLPTGSQPTVAATGSTVTVSWAQSTIAGLGSVGSLAGGGYVITRYADASTTPVTPGPGCAAVISGSPATLTCAEAAVPQGRWRYTVTPRLNLWTGPAGALSAAVVIDTTAPTTTATTSPAANAAGWVQTPVTVTLTAVDNVNGSGVASIRYSATGAQPISQQTYTAPFAIAANGVTTLSFAATDNAGNVESTKTLVVRIDGTPPTGSISGPAAGSAISGLATVSSSSADALSGVASAAFQVSPASGGAWTTFGTAATAPWRAVLDTTTLQDGAYSLRVVTADWAGNTFTSASVGVVVDNRLPTGIDVQATNGGVSGTIGAGDTMTYTYSESIVPGSILPGWTGGATAVTVRVRPGGGAGNRFTVRGVNLGTVRLGANPWVQGTVTFAATMTMTAPNVVTVTLGSCSGGCAGLNNGVGAATLTWTPSRNATDLAGHQVATTSVTETGGPKQNF